MYNEVYMLILIIVKSIEEKQQSDSLVDLNMEIKLFATLIKKNLFSSHCFGLGL